MLAIDRATSRIALTNPVMTNVIILEDPNYIKVDKGWVL